jgi:beta-galactosidase
VLTEVIENNNVIDTYETTFGVRAVEINKDGVFLNGKLCPVKGTCNHQDFAGIGVALPDKINWYKLKLLKETEAMPTVARTILQHRTARYVRQHGHTGA